MSGFGQWCEWYAAVRWVALGLVAAVSIAGGVSTSDAKSRLRTDVRLASPILKRDVHASVYLPSRYFDRRAARARFPVVYLLHGLGDDHTAWPRLGKIKRTLDRMIARRELVPVIVVMPDAGRSWYANDVRADGYGRVFDAFRSDLPGVVDQTYRTIACAHGRAIGGLSMGGYGALILGTAQPKRFGAVFSLSGATFPANLADEPKRRARLGTLFGGVHGTPVRVARIRAWNVFDRLKALGLGDDVPPVWLSAGDDDAFPSIVIGSVRAFQILQRRQIPAELRIDDAGHTWAYWRKSIVPALKWAAMKFGRKC